MKRIVFFLAFLLMGTFAYANNTNSKINDELSLESFTGQHISSSELASCRITVRKKNPDGTWIEYEIIVHGTDCDKLIKSVISSL